LGGDAMGAHDQTLTPHRRAWVARQSFAIGIVVLGVFQFFLRLPANWLIAVCFLWFSLKTLILFTILRPDRPITFVTWRQEVGVIGIAHLALILLSGGLAWLGARSFTAETLTAVVIYAAGYTILRRRFRWHPLSTG
jgi:hypothetical protein